MTAASPEFQRFINIHEQLYQQTLNLLEKVPSEVFSNVPVDSEYMFLGTRVNAINIGALLRHLIIAEVNWITNLKAAKDGDPLPRPKNAAALDHVEDGQPLVEAYKEAYAQGKAILEVYIQSDHDKEISFVDRKYTGMGFLWVIFGHHSYHIGQMDMLMRQNNINPPEYMEWDEVKEIVV